MLVTKYNYDKVLQEQTSINESLNIKFLELIDTLKKEGFCADKLNMIMLGNSISAGYSKCDDLRPLFMRNKLYDLASNEVDINYYSFTRIRHNQESIIQEWYQKNKSHNEVNKLLIEDIILKKHTYNPKYWGEEVLDNYRKVCQRDDIGLRDLILDSNNGIILYNGLTGVFTDIFRNCANLTDAKKIFTCFEKDLRNAMALCNQIYLDNPSVQIYFSGVPNVMGLKLSEFYNHKLFKLCKKTPNITYVPSSIRSFFYVEGQHIFDIHYSNPEYMMLLNNFMSQILDNYVPNMFICELISSLRNENLETEKENAHSIGDMESLSLILDRIIQKYRPLFEGKEGKFSDAIQKIIGYYDENYLPLFCCTPRKEVMKELKKMIIM